LATTHDFLARSEELLKIASINLALSSAEAGAAISDGDSLGLLKSLVLSSKDPEDETTLAVLVSDSSSYPSKE
jgi:hypothetical protein